MAMTLQVFIPPGVNNGATIWQWMRRCLTPFAFEA